MSECVRGGAGEAPGERESSRGRGASRATERGWRVCSVGDISAGDYRTGTAAGAESLWPSEAEEASGESLWHLYLKNRG